MGYCVYRYGGRKQNCIENGWKIMKNKNKQLILLAIFLFLSGCAGRTELNELMIVSAVGVDIKDGKTIVHFQVVNPSGTTGGQSGGPQTGKGGAVYTYSVSGKTIYEAVEKGRNIFPRRLLFSHITSVVIGESYARTKGIAPIFDFLERNHEVRDNLIMFVAKGMKAREILGIYLPIYKNPGESLKNRVKLAATSTGISEGIKEKDVVRWRYGEFRDPVIQGVEVLKVNDQMGETSNLDNIQANTKTFRIKGVALFKKDKMVGWFDNDQTRGWAIIDQRVKDIFILTHKCDHQKGNIGFMIKNIDSKIKPHYQDGKLKYVLHAEGKAILQEVTCNLDVGDPNELHKMEKLINKEIKQEVMDAVKKAQKQKIDIFGFGKLLYNKYPDVWKQKKKNWEDEFAHLDVETHVKITLESVGARVETINAK
jgi:spore germination protein KC